MKRKALFPFVLLLCTRVAFSQSPNDLSRLELDPDLRPFYHGVASGDPLQDRVIIWTRVTTEDAVVTVSWKMATDTVFSNVVSSGTATTDATRDYTIKVDVTDLQPATYYYYQFELENRKSLIGRTKTAPSGDNDHIRFAVVSCANYENGYFNAYGNIAARNDIDAVLHLGDYIYEYGIGGLPGSKPERPSEPATEILTLEDYRVRHSHYKLEPQLRAVHQQYPFITTWDDHETANNSWYGGADNHSDSAEGDWFVRKANGKQAYFEWLPVRESGVDSFRVYRKLNYGQLADLIVLDTRLEGRDEQDGLANQDTNRTILGHDQYNWLIGNLEDNATQWKIVGQQVMIAPLNLGALTFTEDQWDGYPQERLKLFNHVLNNNIENFVVLTGDIHTSWANELKLPGSTSAGVEFVAPSVTTTNADIAGIALNPAILFPGVVKWGNLNEHGYIIVDITKDRVQSDWYFMDTIDVIDTNASRAISWFVTDGQRLLNSSANAAPGLTNQAALAPLTVDNSVGIAAADPELLIVGAYPNPFTDKVILQFYLKKAEQVRLQVVDVNGMLLEDIVLGAGREGVNYSEVNLTDLPAGNYLLVLNNGMSTFRRAVVKLR